MSLTLTYTGPVSRNIIRITKENLQVDHQNSSGTHALHAACATGSPDIVELLVRKKADVDCRNQLNQTPLIVAAENDQADIIKHLLEVSHVQAGILNG